MSLFAYLLFFSLFGFFAPIISIFSTVKEIYKIKKIKIEKRRLVEKTLNEIQNDKIQYNLRLKEYGEQIILYEAKRKEFINGLDVFKSKYIYEEYLQAIKSKINFNRSNVVIKKGKSENNFLQYLLNTFNPGEVNINIVINADGQSFYPDFLLVSKDKGFCIDIEIDERYDFETKKPIHFIGSDSERNNFFLDMNCFIIRFSEEQVIEQPDNCCLFIKEIVNVITKPLLYELNTQIQNIQRWTYEEAYCNAINNNRSKN